MPNYSQPIGKLGAAAGATGGFGLVEALQGIGDILDAPRKAAWGLFGAPESGSELVAQLSGADASNPLVQALGFGAEMLLDPMNLIGGAGLGKLLGRAGRTFGKGLEAAAQAKGLGYGGDLSKLIPGITPGTKQGDDALDFLDQVLHDPAVRPNLEKIVGEIPEGSKYLSHGAEAIAYQAPDGSVIRIGRGDGKLPPMPGIQTQGVLQPAREVTSGPLRATRVPKMETLTGYEDEALRLKPAALSAGPGSAEEAAYRQALDKMSMFTRETLDARPKLDAAIQAEGFVPVDLTLHNVSRTPAGKWLTHDIGAVMPKEYADDVWGQTWKPDVRGVELREPGRIKNALLRALGSEQSLRREVAERLASTADQGYRF